MKKYNHPESAMMSHGFDPSQAQGAVKAPLYQTSTFVFESAEQGKAFFEVAYGLRSPGEEESMGLIYSRINNPNLEILEKRLCLWDEAEDCAVFQSGMAAISTVLLEFLRPGDAILYSTPTYGGTDHFITETLAERGVKGLGFPAGLSKSELIQLVEESGLADRIALIYVETPANPTNDLFDLAMCKEVATYFSTQNRDVYLAVDNTYMGPLWSHPLQHGADLVLYSATKYIGGHSDLLAGAVLGSQELMQRVRTLRTFLGNMPSPQTAWLLARSLETLKVRMEQQCRNAQVIATYLANHPQVEKVYYLGLIDSSHADYPLYKKQYSAPGAMLAFDVIGGEEEAFKVLNGFELIKMAVSLGSTESLAQHPATMTHVGIDPQRRQEMGISEKMIRLSVGLEHVDDLINDIEQAFAGLAAQSINEKYLVAYE